MKGWVVPFAVLLSVSACSRESRDDIIVGTLERDRLELTAEANEPIVEIAVREGDKVAAGAVLLKLSTDVAQAKLDQAAAAVSVADRRLAELIKGPRSQQILESRAALESAISTGQTAASEFRRVQDLVSRKLLSESELDQVRARRDSATAERKQASARLNLLLEGTRPEEIEQAEAELNRARAALAEVQTSVTRYTMTAPRAGIVEALPFKLGERPPIGAPTVIMLAEGTPYARVYIPETRRTQFSSGNAVRITVDGSDRDYAGVTRFVSAQAQFTPYYALTQDDRSRLSYLAEIDLPDAEAGMLPTGIPVQVRLVQP
ncbi:MAG TPA: HlyD family efflux transporter periplasmic adaptor subunit [Steroidobacteraceae bacterium]|nr:HlyD family efflux transporter periplasmic adaptor subunit [Steroidobacteraceae bacterium]